MKSFGKREIYVFWCLECNSMHDNLIDKLTEWSICNFRVTSDEALEMAKRLAREEAIMGGISSGANVFAAVQVSALIFRH